MTSFCTTIFASEDGTPTGLVSFYSKLLLTLAKHVQVGSDAAKKISEQASALLQLKETAVYAKLKQSLAEIQKSDDETTMLSCASSIKDAYMVFTLILFQKLVGRQAVAADSALSNYNTRRSIIKEVTKLQEVRYTSLDADELDHAILIHVADNLRDYLRDLIRHKDFQLKNKLQK